MFNDHFLDGEKSRTICEDFLHRNHGDGIVMVTDPPFGGRVEILAEVIQRMMGRWTMGLQGKSSKGSSSFGIDSLEQELAFCIARWTDREL